MVCGVSYLFRIFVYVSLEGRGRDVVDIVMLFKDLVLETILISFNELTLSVSPFQLSTSGAQPFPGSSPSPSPRHPLKISC